MTITAADMDIAPTQSIQVCHGATANGARCRRKALRGERFCRQHSAQATPVPSDIDQSELADVISELGNGRAPNLASSIGSEVRSVVEAAASGLARARELAAEHGVIDVGRFDQIVGDVMEAAAGLAAAMGDRVAGQYEEDEFGFDEQFTNAVVPFFAMLYDYWWRVDVEGIENVPAEGAGLLVCNHAGGGIPFDGGMIKMAVLQEHSHPRHVRVLALDWLMGLPFLGDMARRTGQTLACTPNAVELLKRGHLVGVFPEGVKGMSKPFSRRYQLERFGRGGFVRIAMRTGVPIVPVAIVGSEEIYPKIATMPSVISRLFGAPFMPITPLFPWFGLLGLIPLPSKWHIEFCDPIDVSAFPPSAADDRGFVLDLSDQIRETIQERLRANLLKRKTPFW